MNYILIDALAKASKIINYRIKPGNYHNNYAPQIGKIAKSGQEYYRFLGRNLDVYSDEAIMHWCEKYFDHFKSGQGLKGRHAKGRTTRVAKLVLDFDKEKHFLESETLGEYLAKTRS